MNITRQTKKFYALKMLIFSTAGLQIRPSRSVKTYKNVAQIKELIVIFNRHTLSLRQKRKVYGTCGECLYMAFELHWP